MTEALKLNSEDCRNFAMNYSWNNCTEQFFNSLVPAFEEIIVPKSSLMAEHL